MSGDDDMEKTSRYRGCVKYRDLADGVIYRQSCPRRVFRRKETDQYHILAQGERLDLLAYRYYGDAALWWVIAEANNIANPLRLEVGMRLRVPARSTVFAEVMV